MLIFVSNLRDINCGSHVFRFHSH